MSTHGQEQRRRPGRPSGQVHTERLEVRLTPGQMAALDRVAAEAGMQRAVWVRRAIARLLTRQGDGMSPG